MRELVSCFGFSILSTLTVLCISKLLKGGMPRVSKAPALCLGGQRLDSRGELEEMHLSYRSYDWLMLPLYTIRHLVEQSQKSKGIRSVPSLC